MPVRLRSAAAVLVLGLAAGVVAVSAVGHVVDRPQGGQRPTAPLPVDTPALSVLHDWDVRRAAAWAADDPARLASLYVEGSSAGSADVALLRRYRARGLVVHDIRMQVLRARVVTDRPRRLVLEVTDRLAVAIAYGPTSGERRLPLDTATTHELVLRRVDGEWRMARVSAGVAER